MQEKINKLTKKLDQEYKEKQTLDEMLAQKSKNLNKVQGDISDLKK